MFWEITNRKWGWLGVEVCGRGEGTYGCRPAGALVLGDAALLYTCRPFQGLEVGESSMGISYRLP